MKSVHTFIELVQCPLCRRTFMEQGEECCWRCAPRGVPPTGASLAAARRVRQGAEMAEGSLGSLAGIGFAPLGAAPIVFGAPRMPAMPQAPPTAQSSHRRVHTAATWMILRWAVVAVWLLFALYAIVSILQHRPIIGPR